jgi:hypothetical protein
LSLGYTSSCIHQEFWLKNLAPSKSPAPVGSATEFSSDAYLSNHIQVEAATPEISVQILSESDDWHNIIPRFRVIHQNPRFMALRDESGPGFQTLQAYEWVVYEWVVAIAGRCWHEMTLKASIIILY